MGDYHVHLHPHGPYRGEGPPPGEYPPGHIESYVEVALGRGADEVGFTEHLYRCVESASALGPFWEQAERSDLADDSERFVTEDRTLSLARYVEAVVDAKARGLPVLLGLEVDFFPDTIAAVLDVIDPYPWDFLVGSIHWIEGWSYDRRGPRVEFERRGVRTAYEQYFALETLLAASGAVDVLGHVDAVKKQGYFLPEPPVDLYQPVVAAAAASGTAVEVNTSGLRHPAAEIFPSAVFLSMFHDAGVPITLSSDAHVPHGAALDRDAAVAHAVAAGYTERLRFDGRVRTAVPLSTPATMGP